jgi:hypothetical protein
MSQVLARLTRAHYDALNETEFVMVKDVSVERIRAVANWFEELERLGIDSGSAN